MTSYNYTTGNSLTGEVTRTYAYDVDKRLTSVTENGVTQSISGYDALGNPSSYKGKTLTWTRGRMLASCGSDSYLYDMDGVRQEKTVNGVTHTYYTDGTKIIAEKVGDKVFEYYYDAQGIIGFKYDGNVYYYKKNLQGDIDRIYDANKNLVAEYKYDAWGNHRIYSGEGLDITENATYNNSVAKVNPFRYRGYYYDAETGLYYLNSRYYDPSIGRFINADDISYIQPTDINGLNLYAYCGNNPVMYTDPNGNFVLSLTALILIGFGVSAAISAGASIISQGIDKGWDNINWWQVGLDGLIGGISGALSMTGLNVFALAGINAGLSFIGSVGGNLLNGADFGDKNTWIDIGISTGIGFVVGLTGGRGATNAGYLNGAKRSAEFLKAAASYDRVLTKIAAGGYKNLAGAAGAKFLTRKALIVAWNKMIVSQAGKSLMFSLIRAGAASYVLNIAKSFIYNAIGW